VDLSVCFAEIAGEHSCGPDFEYHPEFLALQEATLSKPEQQFGETVIPAELPDWRAVEKQALALCARTKDLRIAVILARACLKNYGIEGLAQTLQLILQWLQQYWDDVHPRIEADGEEHDPFLRTNALMQLVDTEALIADLRSNVVISPPGMGSIQVRQLEMLIDGKIMDSVPGSTPEQVLAALREAKHNSEPTVLALEQAREHLEVIDRLLHNRLGDMQSPDLDVLLQLLSALTRPLQGEDTENTDVDAAMTESAMADNQGRARSGEIRSRDDALRALDRVCVYLERHEPTNPAPFLLRRAKKLMTSNFLEIIQDLAPDSVNQIERVTGPNQ
jgi:type VI secretion-associated protein, ImpA family